MPTYQYSCTDCGQFLEVFQSFSDDALTTCPECEGRLRKMFNAVGVVFKGSGFYRTDSRTGTPSSESGSSSAPSTPSTSASTSSSSSSSSSSSGDGGKASAPAASGSSAS